MFDQHLKHKCTHTHTHINVTTAKWHQETTIYLVWVNASLHECKMEQSHLQGNVQSECNCCGHHLGVTESKKRLWVWWTWTWENQNDWERRKTKTALFKNTNRAAYYCSASIIIWPWLFVSIRVLHNRPDSDQMFPCKPPWIAHMVSDCSHTLHSPQPLLRSAPLRSHHADLLHPGKEPGHMSLTISHIHGFSQRLMETHCELLACLLLKQRHRQACLNALCFCHNGQAFGDLPIYYSALTWAYYTTQHFCLTPVST